MLPLAFSSHMPSIIIESNEVPFTHAAHSTRSAPSYLFKQESTGDELFPPLLLLLSVLHSFPPRGDMHYTLMLPEQHTMSREISALSTSILAGARIRPSAPLARWYCVGKTLVLKAQVGRMFDGLRFVQTPSEPPRVPLAPDLMGSWKPRRQQAAVSRR